MRSIFNLFCIFSMFLVLIDIAVLNKRVIAQQEISNFASSEQLSADDKSKAQAVLAKFFKSLTNGNTAKIKALLKGKIKEKNEETLITNPLYSNFLKKMYKNARFEIKGYEVIDQQKMLVDVNIILNDTETRKVGLVIVKKFLGAGLNSAFFIYDQIIDSNRY